MLLWPRDEGSNITKQPYSIKEIAWTRFPRLTIMLTTIKKKNTRKSMSGGATAKIQNPSWI